MTEFFKRTETHFRFMWEALVSNRLAIHLLSSGSAMYDMVLRQYLHYYQNYDVTLDHFLTGLDALGTGRLMFQVLDPDELDLFLSAIRRQLREERSPFELAFNHTYQFYAICNCFCLPILHGNCMNKIHLFTSCYEQVFVIYYFHWHFL